MSKNLRLKLPKTLEIADHSEEHLQHEFIQNSPNRARFLAFEGLRSSTKMRKASTHDPHKEIRRETA